MISLVVIGKLNTTSVDSVATADQTNETQWIIPVHSTTLHKQSMNTASPLLSETGKFRSWRLLRDVAADNE